MQRRVKALKRETHRNRGKPAGRTAAPVALDPRFTKVVAALARDGKFAEVLAAYRADLESGSKKFGAGGLKVDGKLFAMMSKGRLVVKLPKERVDGLVAARKGIPFEPSRGRKMKEWLAVMGTALPWEDLAREAHAFVSGTRR